MKGSTASITGGFVIQGCFKADYVEKGRLFTLANNPGTVVGLDDLLIVEEKGGSFCPTEFADGRIVVRFVQPKDGVLIKMIIPPNRRVGVVTLLGAS